MNGKSDAPRRPLSKRIRAVSKRTAIARHRRRRLGRPLARLRLFHRSRNKLVPNRRRSMRQSPREPRSITRLMRLGTTRQRV